jgi:hypothetical protein
LTRIWGTTQLTKIRQKTTSCQAGHKNTRN